MPMDVNAPPLMPSSTSRNPRVVSYPSQPMQLHVGTRSQLTQYVGAGELSTIEVLVASSTPQQGEEANPVQFAASNFASACPDYTSCGQLALAVVNRKRKRVSVLPVGGGGRIFRMTPVQETDNVAVDSGAGTSDAAAAAAHRADMLKLAGEFGTQRVQRQLARANLARVDASRVGATLADASALAQAARRRSDVYKTAKESGDGASTTTAGIEAAGRNAPAGHDKKATSAPDAYPLNHVLGPALVAAYAPFVAAIKKAAGQTNADKRHDILADAARKIASGALPNHATKQLVPRAVLHLLGPQHTSGGDAAIWLSHLWSVLRLHAATSRSHGNVSVPPGGLGKTICNKELGGLPEDVARDLLSMLREATPRPSGGIAYSCSKAHAAREMSHALVAALGATSPSWSLPDVEPIAREFGVSAHVCATLLSDEIGCVVQTKPTKTGSRIVTAELLGSKSHGKALGELMRVPRRAPSAARGGR
ncbi:hypothetical protein RI054_29g119800 [Pseudoscourfieldia marina]